MVQAIQWTSVSSHARGPSLRLGIVLKHSNHRHTRSQQIWYESKLEITHAESQLPGPTLKRNYKFGTEAHAEDKPPQSHGKNSLFILAKMPKVESRKAFSQVVNSAAKRGSGVFEFKTSWAITAETKFLGERALSCCHCYFPIGLGSSKMRAFIIYGIWAFISDDVKYFIQRAHLHRLGNSSQPLLPSPPSTAWIFNFHFIFLSLTIIPEFKLQWG